MKTQHSSMETYKEELLREFIQREMSKYEDMLWYHRSHSPDSSFWDTVPEETYVEAMENQTRIEDEYPEMVLAFEKSPDFQHGFVSGTVAMLRMVEGVVNAHEMVFEGDVTSAQEMAEWAVEEYPELST